jgi:hypothetical protein
MPPDVASGSARWFAKERIGIPRRSLGIFIPSFPFDCNHLRLICSWIEGILFNLTVGQRGLCEHSKEFKVCNSLGYLRR